MPGPLDEITDKLSGAAKGAAKDGVRSAVLDYLNGPSGQANVKEAVGSLKTFLFVVGAAAVYAAARKKA
jgi:hypothetical protein